MPDGTPHPAFRHPAAMPGDGASGTLTDAACGALSGAAVGDALGGATEGYTPDEIQRAPRRLRHRDRRAVQRGLARRPTDRAVPQGRRPRHRRHPDDAGAGRRLRRGARPSRRLRDRRPSRAATDRRPASGSPSSRPRRCSCSGSSSPRSGSSPACTTATSTRARPASATSSTAARRCTWRPSASSTPAIRRVRTPRRSTWPVPTSRATAARPPACSPPPWPRRCVPARRSRPWSTRRWVWPTTARGRRSKPSPKRRRTTTSGRPPSARCAMRSPRSTPSGPTTASPALDARRPSRTKAIEELPVALGMALVTGGDYTESVLGACNYGRDADSIATMAGAVTGALGGMAAVPERLADDRRRRRAASTSSSRGARWPRSPAQVWADDARAAAARDAARSSLLADR